MVTINLLPWREYLHSYQVKLTKKICFLAACLSLFTMISLNFLLAYQEKNLQHDINELEHQIGAIKIDSIPHPYLIDAPLQKKLHRFRQFNHLLLVGILRKQSICFTDITLNNNQLTFIGKANSLDELTQFLLHWPLAKLFMEIKVEQLDQTKNLRFRFQAINNQIVNLNNFNSLSALRVKHANAI